MTVRYELLMLAVPEITKDETAEIEKQLDRCLKKADASMLSFERWGKYRLAYPVRKNDYGIYFLARFEGAAEKMNSFLSDVRSLLKLKLNSVVMRDMISKLPNEGSLAYQRPESLEEAPTQDVDSFLRKNKMEGLLSSGAHDSTRGHNKVLEEGFVEEDNADDVEELEG